MISMKKSKSFLILGKITLVGYLHFILKKVKERVSNSVFRNTSLNYIFKKFLFDCVILKIYPFLTHFIFMIKPLMDFMNLQD